eukprot:PITA_33610
MPTFLGADTGAGAQQEAKPGHMGDYFAEYQAYGQEFRDALSFRDFVQLQRDSRPHDHHRGNRHYHDGDTHRAASRFHLSTFDGSSNSSVKSWVEKLDIYYQLNQMSEAEAIKVATLHLDGKAQDWWFHVMVTLEHSTVTTYAEFTRRLIERFDRRGPEQHFVELTRLKQTGSPKTYITDFLRVSVMVPDLSTARRDPDTLPPKQPFQSKGKDVRIPPPKGNPGRVQIKDDVKRELKKKQLCFTCQEPWAPGHRCAAGKAHFIEVFFESSGEEDDKDDVEAGDSHALQGPLPPPPPAAGGATFAPTRGALATLRRVPKYLTLRVQGTVRGQQVSVLVDSGATHNFINAQMVEWRGIQTESFDGFSVLVPGDQTMTCARYVPEFSVTMGTYTLTDHFFVVNIPDTNMILGVQWLITLGKVKTDWKTLEMEWNDEKTGRHEKIRGQRTYPPQTVSTHRMEVVFWKGDIEWAVELRASEARTTGQTVHPEIQSILDRYAIVFGEIPPGRPPDRGFEHIIELEQGIQAVIATPYRHPKAYQDEIERAIQELLALGHIRPSTSPFASSVVLVKKDGTLRMCINYRALNKKTLKNRHPIPKIDELMDELRGARFFSKVDLRSRYHQIRMREQDIPKTAFRCHCGHFEFLVIPFGLTNAPATFQSYMNHIFRSHLRKFVLVFFDDILIYSKTWEEHLQHIETILHILQEQQFYAKLSKCEFGLTEMLYLRHIIGVDRVRVLREKIRAIKEWPEPRNVTELRGFIGICTYYRKFVKGFSQLVAPLTNLTRKEAFSWSDIAQRAFDRLKEVMSSYPVLALPNFRQRFVLECDASREGIGVVLMQGGHPIAFESRKLLLHERLYSIYDKEMLAIMHALAKYRQYLVGNRFRVRTDHNNLKFFLE